MRHVSIDIETRSGADIKKVGAFKYARDPDFRILLIAVKVDDGPTRVLDLTDPESCHGQLMNLRTILHNPEYMKHAYNAAFEWWCFNQAGFSTPISQWDDTMARVQYIGYPASLDAAGKALGIAEDKQKLAIGKTLIKTFCQPHDGMIRWTDPKHEPERWALFKEYNGQDVEAEYAIQQKIRAFPMPEAEMNIWRSTTLMNAWGTRADVGMAEKAIMINESICADLIAESKRITGLSNPGSNKQLTEWLEKNGCIVPNLRAETVDKLVSDETLPAVVRRVLRIKQLTGKSSVSKYDTILDTAGDDGRIRGLMQYYGAGRTGRFAGRGLQPQNLPRVYLHDLDTPRNVVMMGHTKGLELLYDNPQDVLSQLIRTALIASEGCTFVVADFSAIEARVIAWLAGETWVNEVFATHGKIYEATAAQMFHVPIETIAKGQENYGLRQKGKVATLALGYQGGVGALITMHALDMGLKEEELPEIVSRWRQANPHIAKLWYEVEEAALSAVRGDGDQRTHGLTFRLEVDLSAGLQFMSIELPNGRKLYYPKPSIRMNEKGRDALHYFSASGQSGKWSENSTYGGKLTENIVQAIARDCLCEVLKRVEAAGHRVVFHVHDEMIVDAPKGTLTVDELCDLMGQPISWAPDLILKGAGFESSYYKKD